MVAKLAVTFIWSVTSSEQVGSVPLQAPLQPVNTTFDGGVAVSVTTAPWLDRMVQVPPQLILPLAPVTVPLPTFVTVIDGTPTLAAAFCVPMKSPNSLGPGEAQSATAQTTE